jgi:hypothetical protein
MLTHRILSYLVGLALGYWVLTLADKQNGFTKKLGQLVGWVILVVSLMGPLCLGGKAVFCHMNSSSCEYSSSCPWNGSMEGGMGHCMDMDGKEGDGGMMSDHCKMKKGMMDGAKDKTETTDKAPVKSKEKSK